ncbi:hypothetical protein Q7P37_000231 [Cladosporium fusiforme]
MAPYIPDELLALISSFLDQDTLPNFRLASKQNQRASEPTFLESYFSNRAHLYTHKSLNRLLSICQSTHLVKCLKSVEILQPDNGVCDQQNYVDWYGPPGKVDWEQWIQDSQAIPEDDSTLRQILGCLKRTGITPKLSLSSSTKPNQDRAYMKPWQQKDGQEVGENTLFWRHDLCDLAAHRLVIAIADSKFPLRSLVLQDICEPTMSRLKLDDDIPRYSELFFGALSNMTSLTSLSLLFSRDPSDGHDKEPLAAMVKALELLPLSRIELRHVSGLTETFVALLSQHEDTLRQVFFEDTGLVDDECLWEEPLKRLGSMSSLQQVTLRDLCKTTEQYTVSKICDRHGHHSWTFRNRECENEITSGIAEIIAHTDVDIIIAYRE